MRTLEAHSSLLLLVDFQLRLMPAIHDGAAVLANAERLVRIAGLLGVGVLHTEQNPRSLGGTVAALAPRDPGEVLEKTHFDALRAPGFAARLGSRRDVVLAGCEAHVCVLQTALGLIDLGRRVFVVRDAVGARRPQSRDAALERMARHGAELVTTEMAAFEWLGGSGHPRFREVLALVR